MTDVLEADVLEADVLEAGKIKKLGRRSKEWSQQLELAYIDLMDSKKAPYQNVLWGAGSDAARD